MQHTLTKAFLACQDLVLGPQKHTRQSLPLLEERSAEQVETLRHWQKVFFLIEEGLFWPKPKRMGRIDPGAGETENCARSIHQKRPRVIGSAGLSAGKIMTEETSGILWCWALPNVWKNLYFLRVWEPLKSEAGWWCEQKHSYSCLGPAMKTKESNKEKEETVYRRKPSSSSSLPTSLLACSLFLSCSPTNPVTDSC